MAQITNPILTGFHPDPSMIRVGEDYYIAVSTFEWFPGVPIYHSRDMKHWELLTHALTDDRAADLRRLPSAKGVWAPCLSYDRGTFYLVYSNVYTYRNFNEDINNFLTTAPSIQGPWTDPVYLNSSGIDPSLFHDDDGKKYVVNQIWDQRDKKNAFYGIYLQEYNEDKKSFC